MKKINIDRLNPASGEDLIELWTINESREPIKKISKRYSLTLISRDAEMYALKYPTVDLGVGYVRDGKWLPGAILDKELIF